MRHRKRGRQLSRDTKHRWALFRNLVTSLFEHERIETTEAKGKELRTFADHMITLAKRGDLAARRRALGFLRTEDAVVKLFDQVAPRFRDRQGGYTRLIKTRRRLGDAAPMVLVELVSRSTETHEESTAKPGKPHTPPDRSD